MKTIFLDDDGNEIKTVNEPINLSVGDCVWGIRLKDSTVHSVTLVAYSFYDNAMVIQLNKE